MKCMLTRWRISTALNEGRTLSARETRHLAACPACSRYVAQARLLDTALGEDRRNVEAVPVHLHTRIMASLREAAAEPAIARPGAQRMVPIVMPVPPLRNLNIDCDIKNHRLKALSGY